MSALSYATTLATLVPGVIALSGSFITVMAEQRDSAVRSARLNDLISLATLARWASPRFCCSPARR